jgi:hypothetical protein
LENSAEEIRTQEETGSGAQDKEETKVNDEQTTLSQTTEEMKATGGNGSTATQDETVSDPPIEKEEVDNGGVSKLAAGLQEGNSKVGEDIEAGAQQTEKVYQAVEAGGDSGVGTQQDTAEKKIDDETGYSNGRPDETLDGTAEEEPYKDNEDIRDVQSTVTNDNKDDHQTLPKPHDEKGDLPMGDEQTGPTEPQTQDGELVINAL